MKAAQVNQYGGVENIEVKDGVTTPTISDSQVLVEVGAASLNRIDSAIRNGYLAHMLPLSFPLTLGGDFAGIIVKVGEKVNDLKIGDEVYGNAGALKGGTGAVAEYATVNSENVFKKPSSITFEEAAALPLAGTSAYQAIIEEMQATRAQKILIQGGAGGVGSYAIQIAKSVGAYTATTVATDDVEYAKALGADLVNDYKTTQVEQVIKEYDALLDNAGGENAKKLYSVLKKGGKFVSLGGPVNPELAAEAGVSAIGQMTKVSSEQLKELASLVEAGKIKIHIEKTFTLDQAREAFEYFETQHPRGKVVIKIKD